MHWLNRWILRLVGAIEAAPMPAGKWFLFLASIIVVRHFLEEISSRQYVFHVTAYLVHYPLAYVTPLIALALVLSVMSREPVGRVSKLMLVAWLLTLLPPLLDLAVRRGGQSEMIGYLLVEPSELGTAFANLLNPFRGKLPGATTGIRLEAFVGCLAGAYYVHLKTKSVGRALATLPIVYVTMFFFFTLPVLVVRFTHLFWPQIRGIGDLYFQESAVARGFESMIPVTRANLWMSLIDVFVLAPLLAVWYRLHDPDAFRRTFRPGAAVAAVYYPLVAFVGAVCGARFLAGADGFLRIAHPFDVYAIVGLVFCSWLAITAAQMLGRKDAGEGASRAALAVTAGLAVLTGCILSYAIMTYVLGFLAVYYLYRVGPIRLARLGGLSAPVLAFASLLAFGLGYSAYAGGTAPLTTPRSMVAIIIVGVTLALLGRDTWRADEHAQGVPVPRRAEGAARGLPAVLGVRPARIVGFAASFAAGLVPGLVLRSLPLVGVGAGAGALAIAAIATGNVRTIPPRLLAVLVAFLVAAHAMGVIESPVLAADAAVARPEAVSANEPGGADAAPELARLASQASELFAAGDFEGAARIFERLVSENPSLPGGHLNLGVAYLRQGKAEEAVRALREAVALAPEDSEAHLRLAQALVMSGDAAAAEGELAKALTIDPGNSEAAALLGDIHMERGECAQAVAAYAAALRGPRPPAQLHAKLAQAYYMMGDAEAAEREIREEIRINPTDPLPHANLSSMLLARGRVDEARAELLIARDLARDPALRARIDAQLLTISGSG